MSNKRSPLGKEQADRVAAMQQGYEARIARQKETIDRLLTGLATCRAGLIRIADGKRDGKERETANATMRLAAQYVGEDFYPGNSPVAAPQPDKEE